MAQFPRISLSDAHRQTLDQIKSPEQKLKKYLKYYSKDSVRYLKNWEKRLKKKPDSLLRRARKAAQLPQGKIPNHINGLPLASLSAIRFTSGSQFTPIATKNEVERLSRTYFKWRVQLAEWYLAKGYYKDDSIANQLVSQFSKLHPTSSIPGIGSVPGLPQSTGLPSVTSSVNGLKQGAMGKVDGIGEIKDAKQLASEAKGIEKYQSEYGAYLHNPDSLASLAKTKGTQFAENEMKSRMGGMTMSEFSDYQKEIKSIKGLKEQYGGQINQLKDSAYLKKQAQEKAQKLAMTYLNDHPEIMKPIQNRMNQLMRKYSVVPNSNDLSSAIKRSSLKGKPIKERLVIATNLQLISIIPVTVDFSPMVGYKFNRKFVVGTGGSVRQVFQGAGKTSFSPKVFGYKGFVSYDVVKHFFAYGEFARNSPGLKTLDGVSTRIWKNAIIIGAGRRVSVSRKLDMTLVIGYNFTYKPGDPIYPRPWIVRVGFQFSELAFWRPK